MDQPSKFKDNTSLFLLIYFVFIMQIVFLLIFILLKHTEEPLNEIDIIERKRDMLI